MDHITVIEKPSYAELKSNTLVKVSDSFWKRFEYIHYQLEQLYNFFTVNMKQGMLSSFFRLHRIIFTLPTKICFELGYSDALDHSRVKG